MGSPLERNEHCPMCRGELCQDSVDVGVGVMYGPRGCTCCGWSEDPNYDMRSEANRAPDNEGGYKDQYGGYHPAGSVTAMAYKLADAFPVTG